MTAPHVELVRAFEPGTTGWSADDLDDPEIERLWFQGSYEIVEGVLAKMPPAYFDGSIAVQRLVDVVKDHFRQTGVRGDFGAEVDIVISQKRVVRVDYAFLTDEQEQRQRELHKARRRRPDLAFGRVLLPPLLIIESVSPGHEAHDRETKFGWFAEFKVPNYWIVDAYGKRLDCFALSGDRYRLDQGGAANAKIQPSLFPSLTIELAALWPYLETGNF